MGARTSMSVAATNAAASSGVVRRGPARLSGVGVLAAADAAELGLERRCPRRVARASVDQPAGRGDVVVERQRASRRTSPNRSRRRSARATTSGSRQWSRWTTTRHGGRLGEVEHEAGQRLVAGVRDGPGLIWRITGARGRLGGRQHALGRLEVADVEGGDGEAAGHAPPRTRARPWSRVIRRSVRSRIPRMVAQAGRGPRGPSGFRRRCRTLTEPASALSSAGGVEQRQLVGLITRRSRVRIPSPQPTHRGTRDPAVGRVFQFRVRTDVAGRLRARRRAGIVRPIGAPVADAVRRTTCPSKRRGRRRCAPRRSAPRGVLRRSSRSSSPAPASS